MEKERGELELERGETGDPNDSHCNGRQPFQLFVVVLDTFHVWEILSLPSDALAATNLTSLWARW